MVRMCSSDSGWRESVSISLNGNAEVLTGKRFSIADVIALARHRLRGGENIQASTRRGRRRKPLASTRRDFSEAEDLLFAGAATQATGRRARDADVDLIRELPVEAHVTGPAGLPGVRPPPSQDRRRRC